MKMPVIIFVDNMGAIFMSKNTTSNSRTRHMDVKWRFLNTMSDDGMVELQFVRSEDQWADI